MSVTTFVAIRYLKSNRENRFFSWIAFLTIVGLAIGVATMVVVLSVIDGFEGELRDRFLAANAHLLAYRFPYGIKEHTEWQDSITSSFGEHLKGISPFVQSETMGRHKGIIYSVLVKGIAPKQRESVQTLKGIIFPYESLMTIEDELDAEEKKLISAQQPRAVILGKALAATIQVGIGDLVHFIATQEDLESMDSFIPFRVVGIYDSGLQHYDSKLAIMSIPAAQHLFNMKGLVTGLEMGLKDPDLSTVLAKQISNRYTLSVKEWQSYNSNIFEAMKTERTMIGLIVALVAFVASFNVLTTQFIAVTQKNRDIAILKAMGASNRLILSLFLKQSALIGTVGSVSGMIVAFILSNIIEHITIIRLPDIYLLTKLPVIYDWRIYALVTICSVVIAIGAGVYPAVTATLVSPTEGIREGRRQQAN